MTALIFVAVAVPMAVAGYRTFRPVGWWIFRVAHRNDPDALAFADCQQGQTMNDDGDDEVREMA